LESCAALFLTGGLLCWHWLVLLLLQRDVLISAVADDQLKEHGVIAVTFASPKETPVSGT
jgi:hypothetical protein